MSGSTLALLALGIALLFFAVIPGMGAFSVRSQWRVFRRRILQCSQYPFLRYADISSEDGPRGSFRVFGELEAIQGKNRIWINTGSFTVEADLQGVKLYLLPSLSPRGRESPLERMEETLPDEEPAVVPWSGVFSLPSGMSLFVGGSLFLEEGRGVFRSQPKGPLLVVFYDGERQSILKRAIWGGRKKNEYWNQFTLASLLTGSFCLTLLSYVSLRALSVGLPSLLALSLALSPVSPLLPPGVALYYLYRFFWKKARRLRAERDLLRLPLRYFAGTGADGGKAESAAGEQTLRTHLPTGEPYVMSRDARNFIQGELSIRGMGGQVPAGRGAEGYWLFGVLDQGESHDVIRTPQDPMAELVFTLGDPAALAVRSNRAARLFELLAASCVGLGIGANLLLILLLLRLLLR